MPTSQCYTTGIHFPEPASQIDMIINC